VSGSDDKMVPVWDTTTGAALQRLKSYSGPVNSVAFLLNSRVHTLYLSNNWVAERGVLQFPPHYRTTYIAVWNGLMAREEEQVYLPDNENEGDGLESFVEEREDEN
jgi:hypothetical protein